MDGFYVEAYQNNFYLNGVLRLYRRTLTPSRLPNSNYMSQSVRIRSPEEIAKIKPVLDYLAGKIGWEEFPVLLETLEDKLKEEKAFEPETLRLVEQYTRYCSKIGRFT